MSEKLYIHINRGNDIDTDMFSEMKDLGIIGDKKPLLISDISTTKKKKKNKKKKEDIHDDISDTILEVITNDNISEVENREYEYDIDGNIIQKEKRNYKGLKSSQNQYKKEFAEELTLLYNLLDEVTGFGKTAQKKYLDAANNSRRGQGMAKYMTEYAQMVLSSQTNRLNIIKELSSIKKTIADLNLKESKNKPTNEQAENNTQIMAANFLKQIMNSRKAPMAGMGSAAYDANVANGFIPGNINPSPMGMVGGPATTRPIMNVPSYTHNNEDYEDNVAYTAFREYNSQNMYTDTPKSVDYSGYLQHRLSTYDPSSDPNPYYRSDEGNRYIQYENESPKIVIDRNIDTNEWEFAAVNKNDEDLPDYPLPSKSGIRLKFSEDGRYASDSLGNMYPVRNYSEV